MMRTRGEKIFSVFNTIILSLIALACLIPVWHVICCSVSEPTLLNANRGTVLWPLGQWTFLGYEKVFKTSYILRGYLNTVYYVILGTAIGLVLPCLAAYGLSRKDLMLKKPINFFITFTMLFNGGLVATYIVMTRWFHLKDSMWILILPVIYNPFYVVLMKSFFMSVPDGILEAARIDGENEYGIFFRFVIPMSKPIFATVALFLVLLLWNDYQQSLLYISKEPLYKLQYLLMKILNDMEFLNSAAATDMGVQLDRVSMPTMNLRMAMCVVAAGPILLIFPFFQKYFTKGVNLGGIKE